MFENHVNSSTLPFALNAFWVSFLISLLVSHYLDLLVYYSKLFQYFDHLFSFHEPSFKKANAPKMSPQVHIQHSPTLKLCQVFL